MKAVNRNIGCKLKGRFGVHRVNPRNGVTDVEEGSNVFNIRPYTFSYEATDQNMSCDGMKKTPATLPTTAPAFDFGTAFDFSKSHCFENQNMQNTKKTKGQCVPDNFFMVEEVPTYYQSIFTYESIFLDDPKLTEVHEDDSGPFVNGGIYLFFVILSALFLIFTFPITALFCVKRLSITKKMIIFRLGKLLKPRGPGCVLSLPFVDECHIIDLAEQSLTVKPLNATTSDSGEVEVGCQVVFHIVEPEAAVTYWSRDPHGLVLKKAEAALIAAVARIQWYDIITGHGSPDVAGAVRGSLNAHCSPIGIQILEVKLTTTKSIKDPPTHHEKVHSIDFHQLGKQIASLSPLLISRGGDDGSSFVAQNTQFTNIIAALKLLPVNKTPDPSITAADETVTAKFSQTDIDQLVERTLARSQIFLNNERARSALGSASLQVFVYASDINREDECVAAFFIDACTGKGEIGTMEVKNPSTTVHIRAAHLADTLEGRLDLLEAMKMSKIRFSGSLLALSKLRYLLQFK